MADATKYNLNNPAVKRIMREVKEMEKEQSSMYYAKPMEPNGRFEVGKKICLSISAYHPEYWQPGWSIRTALVALIGFMPTQGEGAIGALDYPSSERKILAGQSPHWKCDKCGVENNDILPAENAAESENIQNEFNQVKAAADSLPKESGPSSQPSTPTKPVEEKKKPETPVPIAQKPVEPSSPSPAAVNPPPTTPKPSSTPSPAVVTPPRQVAGPPGTQGTEVRRQQRSTSELDYVIYAVVALIIGLLVKKFYL